MRRLLLATLFVASLGITAGRADPEPQKGNSVMGKETILSTSSTSASSSSSSSSSINSGSSKCSAKASATTIINGQRVTDYDEKSGEGTSCNAKARASASQKLPTND